MKDSPSTSRLTPASRPAPRGWERGKGWGPWGETDEVGALNGISPEIVQYALHTTIQNGTVYDLDPGRRNGMAVHWFHPPYTIARYRYPPGIRVDFGFRNADVADTNPRGQSGMNELVISSQHSGAHVDALCHITVASYPGKRSDAEDDYYYNGLSVRENVGDFGVKKADIASTPPIVTRGVLLDLYGFFQAQGEESRFESDLEVTPDHLRATLEWQGAEIYPGDSVLLRTGCMRDWGDWAKVAEWCRHQVGPGREGAEWLVLEKGAVFLGADTMGLEHQPPAPHQGPDPVHAFLLVEQGVHIGEMFWLEDLARDRAYEFAFIVSPLKLHGATGSMVRPIAIT